MHELLNQLTALLNQLFGGPLTDLMDKAGVPPAVAGAPIHNRLTLQLIVTLGLVAFFIYVRLRLSVEKPAAGQQLAEIVYEFVEGQARDIIHHDYEKYLSYGTMILVFVLLNNLMGLLPGIDTPTSSPVVPLGLAILTFIYYNIHGLWKQGPVGYFKHFLGDVWWLTPLWFPLEIVSHLARMVSLTIRLYANMFASDLLTLVTFSFVPAILPIVFLGLHFGVAVIQCYVFMLLTFIYLSQAVAHEEKM
ncbi:MAG: F0F1 ATP synthase subunit A [Acidobacteriaceae bacterium]